MILHLYKCKIIDLFLLVIIGIHLCICIHEDENYKASIYLNTYALVYF